MSKRKPYPAEDASDFHDGMIAALTLVALYDQETMWRAIVATEGVDVLTARAVETDMAELAGFVSYERKRVDALRAQRGGAR